MDIFPSDSQPLPLVQYEVHLETRAGSKGPAEVLDDACWHVRSFEHQEILGEPYHLEITLHTDESELALRDLEADIDTLIGADFRLALERDEGLLDTPGDRAICGVVRRAWYVGSYADAVHIRLDVVPAVALGELFVRSRVFQGQSVVDIAQEVLGPLLERYGRALELRLQNEHVVRDYCVQFRESDWTFVRRILAEEGIEMVFDQGDDVETLVLIDFPDDDGTANAAFVTLGERFTDGSGTTPVSVPVSTKGAGVTTRESLSGFYRVRDFHPAASQAIHKDWKAGPPTALSSSVEVDANEGEEPWQLGEVYEHESRRLIEDGGEGPLLDPTMGVARRTFREHFARGHVFHGSGDVLGMGPGKIFEVTDHPDTGCDRTYLITRIVHRAELPHHDDGHPGVEYHNDFYCVPAEAPYAPGRRPKPRVYGHQTGVVVGPQGEEIHTDEHGRVKVLMDWDREGPQRGPDASCWIRVAQSWAGPGWGMWMLPRVGMEVIVSFQDGDPDRPLVMGCVYNGGNRPPYPLPDEKTKTTLRSNSSPGGEGFNEFRFEDAAGSEEVFLHAQKDLNEVVLDAHSTKVGTTHTQDIGSNQTITVGGNRSITVTGRQRIQIKSEAQGKNPPPNGYALEVEEDIFIKSNTKHVYVEAPESITLKVGTGPTSQVELTPTKITLTAGNGASVSLDVAAIMSVASNAVLSLDAGTAELTSASQSKLKLDANVGLHAGAGAKLDMDSTAQVVATTSKLKLDGKASLEGIEVHNKAVGATLKLAAAQADLSADAKLTCSSAAVEVSGKAMTKVSGALVALEGTGIATLKAALVKIN